MVEFALVMPMLMVMVFAIFEFGRAAWVYMAVDTASREAARYGSGTADSGGSTPQYLDCDGIRNIAMDFGAPAGVEASDITITYDEGPGGAAIGSCPVGIGDLESGDRIVVQVVGEFELTPLFILADFPVFTIDSTVHRTLLMEINIE